MTTEKFHHQLPDGSDLELPRFNQIPFGIMRKLRKEDEADQMFGLFEELVAQKKMTQKSLDALDSLTVDEVSTVLEAWQANAQVSSGESKA